MSERQRQERVIVASLFVTMMVVTGPAAGAIGVILPALLREFHWTRAQASSLIFASVLAGGLLGPVVGWLIDRAGASLVMAVGFVVVAASYAGLSVLHSLNGMRALYGVFSIGNAMCGLIPGMVVAVNWFGRRKGAGSGLAVFGFALGLAASAPIETWIIARLGWRMTLRFLALPPIIVGLPLALLFITTRPPTAQASAPLAQAAPGLEVRAGLASFAFWQLLAVQMLFALGFGAVFLHIITYLIGVGFTPGHAAAIFSLQTLESGVGVVGLGIVADRLGARRVLALSMVVLASGIMALLGAASHKYGMPMVLLFVVAWGTTATSINTLLPILIAETLGVRRLGTFSGILHFGASIAHALGPLISGILFDMTGNYSLSFQLGAALVLMTGGLVAVARPARGWNEIPVPARPRSSGVGV